jgi:hypothetical protein
LVSMQCSSYLMKIAYENRSSCTDFFFIV